MSAARMCDNCNKAERTDEMGEFYARGGYMQHPLPSGWQRVVAGEGAGGTGERVDIDVCSDHCAVEGLRKALS